MTNKTCEREVLFQKLGNTWYIFSEIDGEIVYSAMPEGMDPHTTKLELYAVIENHLHQMAKNRNANSQAA